MWHRRVINLRPLWRFYLKVNYTVEFFNTLPYSLLKQVYWTLHKLFKRFECLRGYSHHFVNWSIIFTFTNVWSNQADKDWITIFMCYSSVIYYSSLKGIGYHRLKRYVQQYCGTCSGCPFWRNRLLFSVRKHWYRLNTKYFLSIFWKDRHMKQQVTIFEHALF